MTLADYRQRHAQYRSDPDLQAAHARAPFICVWDDHEVANDTWMTGAENHQPATEGDFATRKAAALRAYYEWMPIREPKAGAMKQAGLEPGDRVVFLTDGMLERNAATLDVAAALTGSAALHPREVVHELGAAVLRATDGDLKDDATMVCLDWYGGPRRERSTTHGADQGLASGPRTAARPD